MADERITTFNIGSQQVVGAVFSKTPGGGLQLDRVERSELTGDPGDEDIADQSAAALKDIVSGMKVSGSKSTYVVSSFPVLMKFASLPALDGEQVDQIVEFEAQQQVPYPINEVVWGYQLMGDPDDIEVEVLLAAVKSDELSVIDEAVTAAGLKSQGAEVAPVALYNALRFNYSDIDGVTLLVDIGARTTDMIFMEGGKLFIRTVKIGGADITRAISKEFGTDFVAADHRKVTDGFVALGGPYADHEDPEIAGISKVVRNSLTRLHSEIMRTVNFYRSQQGGSAPTMLLLSGATSGLPFIREFFAEKLSLPVDYFNAFRNVTVAPTANQDVVGTSAHMLGEVVGSALSRAGEVPVELHLTPEPVQKSKDLDKRKPSLILAVVALAIFLGALGFFFSKGSAIASEKTDTVQFKAADLSKYNNEIQDLKDEIDKIDGQKKPYVDAVRNRVYWVRVFNYLSSKMENDVMFMTVLEPLSDSQPVILDDEAALLGGPSSGESTIDAFSIQGLWRENPKGPEVVYDYFKRLKADAEAESSAALFDLKEVEIGEVVEVDSGTAGDRYAYTFRMVLPLPETYQVKFTN
ncbi:MAG: pilus assembly protein PilM [Verrucomicrobiota bacterium]